jgi:hypothetical protein
MSDDMAAVIVLARLLDQVFAESLAVGGSVGLRPVLLAGGDIELDRPVSRKLKVSYFRAPTRLQLLKFQRD